MSLTRHFGGWQNRLKREWPDVVKELKRVAASPKTGHQTLAGYTSTLVLAAVVQPDDVQRQVAPLAATVDRVVAGVAKDMAGHTISTAFLELLDLGNALQCAGCALADATLDVFRDWLGRMQLTRDDPNMFEVWSAGFAALALDERDTYRTIAARAGEAKLAFTPGETFGFNMQALLGHLAAAVENDASLADVTPAWQELLGNYGTLYDGASVRPGMLLWAARVVHHRIAGAPIGEVALRLHDDIRQLAP